MTLTIIDKEKNTSKIIDTPFTTKQWLSINFGGWGFYSIIQYGKDYLIFDKFTKQHLYTIRKGVK